MSETRFFVVVFGNPDPNGDPVESGTYRAGPGYAPFDVEPGDMLLLYCTGGYAQYPLQVPGLGKVLGASPTEISYKWDELPRPILRGTILDRFETEDRQKMTQLRFNIRRVFQISKQSFSSAVESSIN